MEYNEITMAEQPPSPAETAPDLLEQAAKYAQSLKEEKLADAASPLPKTRTNPRIPVLMAMLLIGITLGGLAARTVPAEALSMLGGEVTKSGEFLSDTLPFFAPTALMLVLIYILSFWAISSPIIFLVPLFRGLGSGLILGKYYLELGIVGFAQSSYRFAPNIVFSALIIVIAAKEGLRLSSGLFRLIRKESQSAEIKELYYALTLKFIFLCVAAFAVSCASTGLVYAFS